MSVQWGRKSWMPFGFLAGLVTVGNVIAVLLLVPALAASRASANPGGYGGDEFHAAYAPSGTTIDGEQVSNIFAYDAEGKPLSGVQLFDETGRPLMVGEDTRGPECDVDCMTDLVKIPSLLEDGRPAWNVFPLKEMAEEDTTYDEATNRYVPNEGKELREPTAPFLKVPALLQPKAEEKAGEKGND